VVAPSVVISRPANSLLPVGILKVKVTVSSLVIAEVTDPCSVEPTKVEETAGFGAYGSLNSSCHSVPSAFVSVLSTSGTAGLNPSSPSI
jgi:hypothetical protein